MENTLTEALASLDAIKHSMASFEERLQSQQRAGASDANSSEGNTLAADYWNFKTSASDELQILKGQLQSMKIHLQQLDNKCDEAEQYSRRNCLLIHGVPETPDEDPHAAAIAVLNGKLNAGLGIRDFDRAHRLGKPKRTAAEVVSSGKRPIIIKFLRYQDRDTVWKAKRMLKDSGMLITESLTNIRHRILQEARDRFGPRQVWSQDGRIVVLRSGTKYYIRTSEELRTIT